MKLVKIIIILLLPLIGFSQTDPPYPTTPSATTNITAAEYFFDVDPGFGNGAPIALINGLDVSLSNESLALFGLPEGVHTIFLRTKDANGIWSQTSNKNILIEPSYSPDPPAASNIVAAEYFTSGSGLGGDPGFGQATAISVPTGQTDLTLSNEPVSISGLVNGVNYVYLRTQNADGEWSQTSIQEFTIINDPAYPSQPPAPNDIVAVEYFFDDDPGFGSGTSFPITAGQDISLSNLSLDISGLGNGIHFAFLRTQNASGEWSQTSIKEFEIVQDFAYPNSTSAPTDIIAAEYFFDDDPGLGAGTGITITNSQDISLSNLSLDVSGLGDGVHFVFLRTQNADGEWSQTSSKEFEIVLDFAYPSPSPTPTDIVAAEYFFDSDPGIGSGTSISITPGLDISLTNIPFDISGLNPGTHNLFLRTQNNDGEWSQTNNREFAIQEATDCTSTSTWNGTTWSNGVPDATTNAIIDGDFTLTADIEWCRLDILNTSFTINQDVKLILNDSFDALVLDSTGDLNVEGIISSAGNIQNNGVVQFKSTSTGTAQFDVFSSTITGTGNITVERYIPAKRAFRFLTSPIATTDFIFENWQESGSTPTLPDGLGTHITGGASTDGFDQSGTNNPSMFTFNNDFVATGAQTQSDAWTALPNTNSKTLQAGEPYLTFVRGDRSIDVTSNSATPTNTTLRATGSLHTGSLTFDVGNPTDYLSLSGEDDYYNLVGNPYQAIVDFSAVTRSGLTDFIYVWDASVSDAGSYVTVDITGNTTPPNPFSSDASEFIAPGQSFFVQNDNAPGNSSITFEEADKATGATEVTVFDTYPHFYINSRLYKTSDLQNGDSESDALGLRFSDNYTTLGNNNEDATKLDNPGETYAVINNGLRSIDHQEVPALGHEIDFSITNYTETNYSLTFAMENKPSGLGVFLRDNYLNTQTELTESFVYDFTVDANIPGSNAENRFSLIFDNTTLGIDDNNFGANFSLYPNPTSNGLFNIQTPNLSGEVSVEISNLLGQQVSSQELTVEGQQVDINAQNLSTGLYVVKLSQGNQSFSSKLIVE